jgi:hypothetical protein
MNSNASRVPPLLPSARPVRPVGLVIGSVSAVVVVIILFSFNPAKSSFYPTCQFKAATGLDCPGCGSLRAMHQLLHGNLEAAFQFNALLVASLPIAGWLCVRSILRSVTGRGTGVEIRPAWLWTACAAIVVFGILRNLHLTWLSWMAA